MPYVFLAAGFLFGIIIKVGIPVLAGIYGWGLYVPLLWTLLLGLHQTFWTERQWVFGATKRRPIFSITAMIFGTAAMCCVTAVPAYLLAAWLSGHL
jgi:hypothetical protein